MREHSEYVKLIRRYPDSNRGGGLVKIDAETLLLSLGYAGIDSKRVLMVKRYPIRGNRGTAEIILKFKAVDKI